MHRLEKIRKHKRLDRDLSYFYTMQREMCMHVNGRTRVAFITHINLNPLIPCLRDIIRDVQILI